MAHTLPRPWRAWPRAIPDGDLDAPDDQPSAPLTALAKWLVSVTISVNHYWNQELERWQYYVELIFDYLLTDLLMAVMSLPGRVELWNQYFPRTVPSLHERVELRDQYYPPAVLSVQGRVEQCLELLYHYFVKLTIANLLQVLFSLRLLADQFLDLLAAWMSGSNPLRVLLSLRRRAEQFRDSLEAWKRRSNLQRRRTSPRCGNTRSNPSNDRAAVGYGRLLEDLQAYLKEALETATIIVLLWITIKAILWIDEGIWTSNVFKPFVQKCFYNILAKCKTQDSAMQRTSILCSINPELRDTIFAKLDIEDIFRLRGVCKAFDNVMTSDTFKVLRKPREGLFGPHVFYVENAPTNMTWQWISYDIMSQKWKKMPSFASLRTPNVELFKDFFVAGGCGLMCIDVGKNSNEEELVVYQPLTKEKKVLPHLIHRRRPVLIHIIVNDAKSSYMIIVAGCSTIATKHLSRKTEIYDSRTNCWFESGDIPGPDFALNEYQTGVYVKSLDTLFCIGFLPNNRGRGILAFNVGNKTWMKDAYYRLPYISLFNETQVPSQITIAQLMEYESDVFVFFEQEAGEEVTHSIHKLLIDKIEDLSDNEDENGKDMAIWEQVLCESRNGSRALLANPEFECLAHGKNQFCIFNTVERCGTMYTLHHENGIHTTTKKKLPPFPKLEDGSMTFQSLNSFEFAFELSFKVSL